MFTMKELEPYFDKATMKINDLELTLKKLKSYLVRLQYGKTRTLL